MASVSCDRKTGRRTIQFVGPDRKRQSVRFGKITKKQAESAKLFVEDLLTAKVTGSSPKATTAEWIVDLPDVTRKRLERVGLIAPQKRRECPTLAEWLRRYIEGRKDVKPGTRINLEQVEANLVGFFGDRMLDQISAGDAEEFRIHLKSRDLSEGTVRRRCKRAKQFFAAAVKKRIIDESPFAGLKCGNYANAERYYFVTCAEAEAVLDACPDAEWRLIFALCRYGGLRCPSEILRLTWGDVDWDRMRFTVHSSKTEHHVGGGVRHVPIFAELFPYLRDSFEQAAPGTEHVITRYRNTNVNLRMGLNRVIKKAGLLPWPKLFQNLRSTRETELVQEFPIHVVCTWLGNTTQIATKHYLQVTEAHYDQAVQKAVHFPVQHAAAEPRTDSQDESVEAVSTGVCETMQNDATPCKSKRLHRLTPRGLEPRLPG